MWMEGWGSRAYEFWLGIINTLYGLAIRQIDIKCVTTN
jgi:hypothetical protein